KELLGRRDTSKLCATHLDRVVIAAKVHPEIPDQRQVDQNGDALQPHNPLAMIREECHLGLQQNEHWHCDERNPCNEPQRETDKARSLILWTGQKLQDRKHIQSLPDVLAVRLIGYLSE